MAVTNNAVAWEASTGGLEALYSFMGLDATKRWDGVINAAFRWRPGETSWTRLPPVPGPGRLASVAAAVGGNVYLFGGYTVAEDGGEASLPAVDRWDPAAGAWSRRADIPVPVDDAVLGVWRDSLVYLISGWHDTDNVRNVQVYDPRADRWHQATPIPGPGVFGHSGGLVGDVIVYADGAVRADRPRYVLSPSSWRGVIDTRDPTRIEWQRIADHPGPALYRAAAVGYGTGVWFAGGTPTPYNFDGIGYDGSLATPREESFFWDEESSGWVAGPRLRHASMDHRALVPAGDRLFTVGGMREGQRVTPQIGVLVPSGR